MRFVSTPNLKPGMLLGKDIVSTSLSFMLKKGVTLTPEYISYLSGKGYLGAYIADPGSADVEVVEPISFKTLENGVKAVEKMDIGELMASARQIVEDISRLKSLSIDLLDLRSFDDYTFRHSVNVAVYAVAVATYMDFNEEDLTRIALAGICHDLGKQKIPIEIINKPGALSDAEFALIKKHPVFSFEMLQSHAEISSVVRQAVLCHHENENGSGYPNGKDGRELPLMAKILHAVDVYDALISRRPYKNPYSPAEAFEYLMGGKHILFNEAVVDAMRMVIPTYPTATDVKLSTGETAVVVAHTSDPLRPVVRSLSSGLDLDLTRDENRDIFIVSGGYSSPEFSGKVDKLNEGRSSVKEKKIEIMLVDDSPMALQSTTAALSDDRFHIVSLQSGIASVNYISAKGAPDLIIMDIEMPMLDGVTTVKRIREMGYTDLPIIFLTSDKSRETVLKCIQVQAKDYIIKPVRPVYLRERVEIALDASYER